MPERVTVIGWLSTFAEMAAVREAIDADPVLGTRLDTMVGTEFSLNQRPLDWLLVEHLLEPMIIASRLYEFDEALFELRFNRLDAGLRADTIRFIERAGLPVSPVGRDAGAGLSGPVVQAGNA